jgi:hypothetical protein
LRKEFIERLIGGGVPGIDDALAWDIMMIELWFRERETVMQSSISAEVRA